MDGLKIEGPLYNIPQPQPTWNVFNHWASSGGGLLLDGMRFLMAARVLVVAVAAMLLRSDASVMVPLLPRSRLDMQL